MSRKKSIDVKNLPVAPDVPQESKVPVSPHRKVNSVTSENDPFGSLYTFNDREASILKSLNESIKMFDNENSFSCDASNAEMSNDENKKSCEDECREFIHPLMSRTQESVSALLATKDSLDQLDNLHRIIKQLLSVQEQNYHMRKRLRTVKTLHALKSMEIQVSFFFVTIFMSFTAGDYLKSTIISAKQKIRRAIFYRKYFEIALIKTFEDGTKFSSLMSKDGVRYFVEISCLMFRECNGIVKCFP